MEDIDSDVLLSVLHFKVMANRIRSMRASLFDNLEKLNSPLNWDHIVKQVSVMILQFWLSYISVLLNIYALKVLLSLHSKLTSTFQQLLLVGFQLSDFFPTKLMSYHMSIFSISMISLTHMSYH